MTRFQRGATYARLSKADDEDGVIRQAEDTDALALARGIPVQGRRYVDNDISATKGKHRPDYERLLTSVRAGEVDVVIVYMLGRLWRNRRERAEGIELFREHGVSILTVKGPELDLTTAAGRLLAGLLGEVDTFEVDQLSEREKREALQRITRGDPPSGHRCFGYSLSGWEVVTAEAAEVRAAFDALLAGASLSGIARDLNERGVLNRNGRPWRHNAVRVMLLNERYAGLRGYEGAMYQGRWPALVSEDTWRAARHILTDEDRTTSPGNARVHLLSSVALCGICDDGKTTVTSGSRLMTKGKSGTVSVYQCKERGKHLARTSAPIDLLVEEYVIARLSRPDAALLFVDEEAPDAGELRSQAVALRGRLKALAAEFADDDEGDVMEFRLAVRRLRERLADVESRMTHPQRARVLGPLVGAQDVRAAWRGLSLDRRRAVVELLAEVTILKGKPGRAPWDPETVRIVPRV
ncbi:recombinase family protein [Streptomyces roseofulvus]|uniref:recombinase family protein n=1 Tax=Streptomyces roseofulvus TaxID=33902 RepID=UPI0031FDE51C